MTASAMRDFSPVFLESIAMKGAAANNGESASVWQEYLRPCATKISGLHLEGYSRATRSVGCSIFGAQRGALLAKAFFVALSTGSRRRRTSRRARVALRKLVPT